MYGKAPTFSLAPRKEMPINIAAWRPTHTPGKRQQMPQEKMTPGMGGYSYNDIDFNADGQEIIRDIIVFFAEDIPKEIAFGKYIIELRAFGRNVPMVSERYLFGISDEWELVFEEATEEKEKTWLVVDT